MLHLLVTLLLSLELTLHEAIDKSIEKRGELSSFELSFKCSRAVNQKSNSDNIFELSATIESSGMIRYDQITGMILLRQRDRLVRLSGKPKSFVDEYRNGFNSGEQFRFLVEDREYVWSPRARRIVSRSRSIAPTYRDLPFYLHAFGLGTVYDAGKRTPLEQIGIELKNVHKNQPGTVKDGIARFASGAYVIKFDTNRGYWPVHQSTLRRLPMREGADGGPLDVIRYELDHSCDLEIEEVGSHWVPVKARLETKTSITNFEFEWKSVNKSLDPSSVDVAAIQEELLSALEKKEQQKEFKQNIRRDRGR